MDGVLALCRALADQGTPPGMSFGHAVGDANTLVHWLLWSFGGKMVDQSGIVVIDSSQTLAALDYAANLYQTFVPGTLEWLDADNNQAFLAGDISLTLNGISIYHSAKGSADPELRAIAEDLGQATLPVGPMGRPTEQFLFSQAMVFAHTPYPNAALEYLRFMWEREQYEPWQRAAAGYITQPLRGYEQNAVWKDDPHYAAYRDCTARMLWNGYAGDLGPASAATMANFVLANMFADAVSGELSPNEAIARAERRAVENYRLYSD
jgi:multiple sugar transport system substrate-binding protein